MVSCCLRFLVGRAWALEFTAHWNVVVGGGGERQFHVLYIHNLVSMTRGYLLEPNN